MKTYLSLLGPLLLIFLTSCDRNANQSAKLSIRFPEAPALSNSQKTIAPQATSGNVDNWSSTIPTGFNGTSPFNCYGIYISGNEAELKQNSCYRRDGTVKKLLGMWKGGVPAGQTVEFEVTPGKDRIVGVFAFHASAGACKDFTGKVEMNKSTLSKPYLLGEVGRLNFDSGKTLNVEVPLAFDSDGWFDDCKGPAFNSDSAPSTGDGNGNNNPLADFGTGADGDVVISASSGFGALMNSSGKNLFFSSRIVASVPTGTDPQSREFTVRSSEAGAMLAPNDEVAVYIAAADGTGCGSRIWPGFRSRGIVVGVPSANQVQVLLHDERFLDLTTTQLAASSYGEIRNFCRAILVRVPNINNLNFVGSETFTSVNMQSFGDMSTDNDDHSSGFIFLRVKNSVTVAGKANLDVGWSGYSGGRYGTTMKSGQSSRGAAALSAGTQANGAGGAGHDSSTVGPGGGGHGGSGGQGRNTTVGGGAIEGDLYGCGSSVADTSMKCLFGKIFFGAGGGAGYDANGGSGGGIFIMTAKSLHLGANTLSIYASGNNSGGSTMGGGAGAGGSILLNFSTISATSGELVLVNNGGISNMNNPAGGAGGGGRNHLNISESCALGSGGISMTAYGGPETTAVTPRPQPGGNGTNYISGAGAVSCLAKIEQNQTPHLVRSSSASITTGSTFTLYGRQLTGLVAVYLVNSSMAEYPTVITAQSASEISAFSATAPAGVYSVYGTTISGKKVILDIGQVQYY